MRAAIKKVSFLLQKSDERIGKRNGICFVGKHFVLYAVAFDRYIYILQLAGLVPEDCNKCDDDHGMYFLCGINRK